MDCFVEERITDGIVSVPDLGKEMNDWRKKIKKRKTEKFLLKLIYV